MKPVDVINKIADAIIRQEGGSSPKSVNSAMVKAYGLWNVGHLIWARQRGATRVVIAGRAWAGWPTQESARDGVRRDVAAKIRRGMSLASLISAYAPSTENDTTAYIRTVSDLTGIDTKLPIMKLFEGDWTNV